MKKALIYIFVVITASVVHAQNPTLSPFVISPGGNYASNGGISLSATIGELAAIETFINSPNNIILTQGFQQSNDSIIRQTDSQFRLFKFPIWQLYTDHPLN